jgi:hypothetical protein
MLLWIGSVMGASNYGEIAPEGVVPFLPTLNCGRKLLVRDPANSPRHASAGLWKFFGDSDQQVDAGRITAP